MICSKLLFGLTTLNNGRYEVSVTLQVSNLHVAFSLAVTENVVTLKSLSLIGDHEGIYLNFTLYDVSVIRSEGDGDEFTHIEASTVLDLVFLLVIRCSAHISRIYSTDLTSSSRTSVNHADNFQP